MTRKEFDHTGDLGIEVEARSPAALFEEAALGMLALLTDIENVAGERAVKISLSADDRSELLLKWLSEINFLHLTERLVFGRFAVNDISDRHVEATAFASPIDPARHAIHTEIKAVTYHNLVVERRNDDRWYARIIFDI